MKFVFGAEKEFLKGTFNRGNVITPLSVTKCLFLSTHAKEIYNIILASYEDRIPPSLEDFELISDLSRNTVLDSLKELTDKGFIVKERVGKRKVNKYFVVELDKVQTLRASELAWTVLKDLEAKVTDIKRAWKTYKKRVEGLHSLINDSNISLVREDLLTILNKEGKEMKILKVGNLTKTKTEPVKVEKGSFMNRDEGKWSQQNFLDYYYRKYQDATGNMHSFVRGRHVGMIGNYLKWLEGDKHALRRHIDAFFETSKDVLEINVFCSSNTFSALISYLRDGKKPWWADKKSSPNAPATQQVNMGADHNEIIKRLRGGN